MIEVLVSTHVIHFLPLGVRHLSLDHLGCHFFLTPHVKASVLSGLQHGLTQRNDPKWQCKSDSCQLSIIIATSLHIIPEDCNTLGIIKISKHWFLPRNNKLREYSHAVYCSQGSYKKLNLKFKNIQEHFWGGNKFVQEHFQRVIRTFYLQYYQQSHFVP